MTRSTSFTATRLSSRMRFFSFLSFVRSASHLAAQPAMKLSDDITSKNNSAVSPSISYKISEGSLWYFSHKKAIQVANGRGSPRLT